MYVVESKPAEGDKEKKPAEAKPAAAAKPKKEKKAEEKKPEEKKPEPAAATEEKKSAEPIDVEAALRAAIQKRAKKDSKGGKDHGIDAARKEISERQEAAKKKQKKPKFEGEL